MGAWEALSGKWEQSSAAMTTPVENLVLPLDHHESKRIKTLLRAEKARLLGEGLIFALNVKMELLAADGKPDGMLIAEDCLIDRNTKRGYCKGAVEVKTGTDHLKGRGMYFSTDEEFIKLLSECEIRTFRIPASFGRLR
jgi:lipopolysaccharide export system protein LptC